VIGTSVTVINGTMVSGIAAKNENGMDTMNITITMVTGKTATTIVTATKTTIKILRKAVGPAEGKPRNDSGNDPKNCSQWVESIIFTALYQWNMVTVDLWTRPMPLVFCRLDLTA
jgi:hypothetical protein